MLIKFLSEIGGSDRRVEDVLKVWFITSMFHDVSYSVEKMESWLKRYFERVAMPPKIQVGWADLFTHYEAEKINLVELIFGRGIGKRKDEIANIIKNAFIEEHDHGVIGGLSLLKILHSEIDYELLKVACCAILLHTENVYSKFGRISIGQFPFAFLLVFCDNVQQWGRPRIMSLIPEIMVKLKDIIMSSPFKEVKIKLEYQKLTSEQKRIVEGNFIPATMHWCSDATMFSVELYEEERDAFRCFSHNSEC
ncbi:MAG: hypothetical protein QXV37_00740 [Candidatus Jordarchaeaceae archaeon]